MGPFLKLHNSIDNSPVVVNMDDMAVISTTESNKSSIMVRDYVSLETFDVNESPERIYSLMKQNNPFIRLHYSEDNSVILVNKDIISMIDTGTEDVKSYVYTSEDNVSETYPNGLTINETPDKILDIISKEENKEKV